ncbi:bifunctional 4-hydroxy-2-oxoglutarate aldolase/2-dehydro-3-deoxy-phosphogluconate aldolase [Poritiphilus flavus]|uniref:Bifunctional 4-hydroxy-2-oxoglutarate aldolase/2-dehydro-3-deoxy-phosphogluconate aldolase n=1 Tax=Poritiphilus flavus TaxID=2697053 RepID=A0A6L9E9S9_9FLAO|nr:bifunctional 4-hydroxy-2-oxoglutarate aldolase/2-dehydro-3-deoxy-phosphogluconate aldolase [Poritiphilus flavus]NAS11456.1 bifunctional 4-hydroxy-2-oxoglutarate aldolase/2-dehydro-3-deoxy-phosphogluconate aldolase [Poritiphilus flavus]
MKVVDQEEILRSMGKAGLVPVFNHTDVEVAVQVLDACYKGGVRVFEFTDRRENALEVFGTLMHHAKKYHDLILGIGTIFSAEDAKKFKAKGASFIVSPAMIPEIAHFCKAENLLWIPGCATVTEIYQALQLGAKIVKAFPGNVLGPGFVRSVKAVYPKVPIMPTGGVTPSEENLREWFEAGVSCVGMGSKLIDKDMLSKKDFGGLEKLVKTTLTTINKIRN